MEGEGVPLGLIDGEPVPLARPLALVVGVSVLRALPDLEPLPDAEAQPLALALPLAVRQPEELAESVALTVGVREGDGLPDVVNVTVTVAVLLTVPRTVGETDGEPEPVEAADALLLCVVQPVDEALREGEPEEDAQPLGLTETDPLRVALGERDDVGEPLELGLRDLVTEAHAEAVMVGDKLPDSEPLREAVPQPLELAQPVPVGGNGVEDTEGLLLTLPVRRPVAVTETLGEGDGEPLVEAPLLPEALAVAPPVVVPLPLPLREFEGVVLPLPLMLPLREELGQPVLDALTHMLPLEEMVTRVVRVGRGLAEADLLAEGHGELVALRRAELLVVTVAGSVREAEALSVREEVVLSVTVTEGEGVVERLTRVEADDEAQLVGLGEDEDDRHRLAHAVLLALRRALPVAEGQAEPVRDTEALTLTLPLGAALREPLPHTDSEGEVVAQRLAEAQEVDEELEETQLDALKLLLPLLEPEGLVEGVRQPVAEEVVEGLPLTVLEVLPLREAETELEAERQWEAVGDTEGHADALREADTDPDRLPVGQDEADREGDPHDDTVAEFVRDTDTVGVAVVEREGEAEALATPLRVGEGEGLELTEGERLDEVVAVEQADRLPVAEEHTEAE